MIERAFYSVKEFCERNAISRATFYRRVPQDQLVKVGRKTLVPIACEQAWHASLNSLIFCPQISPSTTSEI